MTEQIVIKLNKAKFKPLLEKFNGVIKGSSNSDSWLVGFALWYIDQFYFETHDYLDNKTSAQHLIEKKGVGVHQALISVRAKYIEFIKLKNK